MLHSTKGSKEGGVGVCWCGRGGGGGDRLESPLKPIHFLWCFFACDVVVFLRVFFGGGGGGGVNC